MSTRETDLVVIGAGPGGYAAAFAAADKGMNVCIVDSDPQPGGVCLNRGCIPSKTLLHIAKLINETADASQMGVTFAKPKIDIDALRAWKNQVVDKNAGGIKALAAMRKVDIIRAWGRFEDSKTLALCSKRGGDADQGIVKFKHAIVAVGSRPTSVPMFDIGSDRVMDSTSALELKMIPTSLLVIGGGYIGLEMGSVYAALGSKVTVVEMTDGLLPGADRDLVHILRGRLKDAFKDILLKTKVTEMKDVDNGVSVTFADENDNRVRKQKFQRVLVSIGRTPNGDGLGLENTKVKMLPRGFVEVNDRQQTADPHIYAIGDIAGEPMLAHKAAREAKVAVEVLAGEPAAFDPRAIPAVVFTDPEIAWAGITEAEAKAQGRQVVVGKFPWGASGRASAIGRNDGLTKVICSPETERILGIGIVGAGAGELIAEAVVAIEMGATAEDLGMCIHPHPTLSETVMEAAEITFGTTTHFTPPKR